MEENPVITIEVVLQQQGLHENAVSWIGRNAWVATITGVAAWNDTSAYPPDQN